MLFDGVAGLYDATRRGYPAEIVSTIVSTATGERYPEPLRTQLRDLWVKYSNQNAPSAGQPAWLAALQETSLFSPSVEATHTRAFQLPAHTVMGVERTRATFLSHSKQDQASFTADLGTLLQPATHIDLAQETFLAVAPSTA